MIWLILTIICLFVHKRPIHDELEMKFGPLIEPVFKLE